MPYGLGELLKEILLVSNTELAYCCVVPSCKILGSVGVCSVRKCKVSLYLGASRAQVTGAPDVSGKKRKVWTRQEDVSTSLSTGGEFEHDTRGYLHKL